MDQAPAVESAVRPPVDVPLRRRRRLRFFRDPKAVAAVAILGAYILIAVAAPLVAPYGVNEQDWEASLLGPSIEHPMGTDRLGRDVLTRIFYGTRISLSVGLVAVGLAAVIGVPLGLLTGYAGGWVDEIIMRFVDAWIAFPNLVLIMAIVAILGPGVVNVMVAIGLGAFPVFARLIRGQVLSVKELEFTTAAHAMGATGLRIVVRHLLPNSIQPVIVQASLLVGSAVIAEAGLSFLGIGIKPPEPTWGATIQEGFPSIRENPVPAIAPGVALILLCLATNLLGDRLRDVLDPRLRGQR